MRFKCKFFTDNKSSLNKLLNEADIVIVSNDSSVALTLFSKKICNSLFRKEKLILAHLEISSL